MILELCWTENSSSFIEKNRENNRYLITDLKFERREFGDDIWNKNIWWKLHCYYHAWVWNQRSIYTWAFSQVRKCRPPPLSFDPVFMEDAQCAETNEKLIFRFIFFELSWKFIENWGDLSTKMTIAREIKIGKIWNWIFLSIQPIPGLSCEFDHFWKKKLDSILIKYWNIFEKGNFKFLVGGFAPHQNASRRCIFFRIGGP